MADSTDIEVVSSEETELKFLAHEIDELEDYWTEERMRTAEPIEARLAEPLIESLSRDVWEQTGTPSVMESRAPEGEEIEPFLESIEARTGFSTSRVTDKTVLPYCTVGKLFMTFDDKNYVGSAWTIAEKAVFTAGHCIFDKNSNGGWADRVLFVPQYDDGSSPRGKWTATKIWSLKGWTDKNDFKYDMGVFEVDRLIRPATGSLGWMANYPPNQGPYRSVGYPASPVAGYNFNGKHMWQSLGGYINGTNPIQMHNNMTGGCSGGPWVVTKSNVVYANGLNSFRYTSNTNTMYSPYFGDGFLNLYNAVKDLR